MTEVVQHTLASSRTTVEVDAKPATKTFKTGKPVAYTSTEPVYVDGTLFKAGEVFVTDKPKGSTWEAVDPVEKATADAGKPIPDDVNLTAMTSTELKAHAASLGIDLGSATSKADIIAVISARNEPTL